MKLIAAAVVAAVTTLSAAPTPPTVKFTDTRLKNGLRIIVAEDHTAPVFSIAVGECRRRRALLHDLQQRRQHERHDK